MALLTRMPPGARALLRVGLGVAVAAATVAIVGGRPFLRGLLAVSPGAVLAAVLLAGIATAAAAWRWSVVSGRLGAPLPWTSAVAAYYRSQFLNTVLPGGILGDVHRAYRRGRDTGDVALAARAVATERIAGQVVQFALVAAVLAVLGLTTPLPGMAQLAAIAAAVLVVVAAIAVALPRGRALLRRELAQLRRVVGAPRPALAILASSILVVAAHAATFVVACLAVGIPAEPRELIGLALVALTAAAVPLNVGGWGPREAASASAFALVGLGAGAGAASSAAFGVLTMLAVAPGAIVLLADRLAARPRPPRHHPVRTPKERTA
jgi:glycosyltransferase 2 family protein